ncbi:MAG: hypothetical protein H6Q59_2674, partial [Firmicutes bacterium]|nr:hypothetical protein [Bacillota bacterium]
PMDVRSTIKPDKEFELDEMADAICESLKNS